MTSIVGEFEQEWVQTFGTNASVKAFSVSGGPEAVYVAGRTQDGLDGEDDYDGFITKYDNTGSKEWSRLLGTDSLDKAFSVDTAGTTIYVAGRTEGDLDGEKNNGKLDAFLSKYNSDGSKDWTRLIGSSAEDKAFSVTISNDGSIYITG